MAVDGYMDELIDFVTREDDPRYDLIKIAIAHHRFVWIHPFTNGNGRTVRLFTYALLMKYGFRVETAQRILNPTAVFCNDREAYYNMLMEADTGTDAGLEAWCEYVLGGSRSSWRRWIIWLSTAISVRRYSALLLIWRFGMGDSAWTMTHPP